MKTSSADRASPTRSEGSGSARFDGLFPPEFLRFLATIPERLRRLHAGAAAGSRAARQAGGSFLVRGHREYRPGDDLRRVDWRVLARHDRIVVREYDAERDARTDVFVDASASMGPEGGLAAAARAAAVAYAVALADGGRGRLGFLTDKGPVVRAEGDSPRDLSPALGHLAREVPAGSVDFATALPVLAASIPRGSRLVLISDLLTRADPSLLHGLGAKARGGAVVHLRIGATYAPEPGTTIDATDVETGARRVIRATDELAARVAARAKDHADRWSRRATEARFAYVPFSPETEPDRLLGAIADSLS